MVRNTHFNPRFLIFFNLVLFIDLESRRNNPVFIISCPISIHKDIGDIIASIKSLCDPVDITIKAADDHF